MPGTSLGAAEDTAMNEGDKNPLPMEFTLQWRRWTVNKIN